MIKITYRIFFEKIYLHLHQNKCQNIRTPPLHSYRATPTLIEGDPYTHRGRPHALTSGTIVSLVSAGVAL